MSVEIIKKIIKLYPNNKGEFVMPKDKFVDFKNSYLTTDENGNICMKLTIFITKNADEKYNYN